MTEQKHDESNDSVTTGIYFGTTKRLKNAKQRAKSLNRSLSNYVQILIDRDLKKEGAQNHAH